jgi:hypothetical protein
MTFHYANSKTPKPPARPKSQPVKITSASKPTPARSLAPMLDRAAKDRDGKVKG